jgi:hypothetical protein
MIKDRRDFLAKVFNTGVWATVASSSLLAPLVSVMAAVPTQLAKGRSIYSYSGDVTVDGEKLSVENVEAMPVSSNSEIVTSASSRIIFAVGKDAHFLRSNSQMKLKSAFGIAKSSHLSRGKLLSVFARRETKNQYILTTPTAVIGIHGTGLYAEAEPELKRSYICTCYGEVKISAAADASISEEIVSKHHDDPRYIFEDDVNGALIQPAPFKDHTDEELQLIESIVGRTTPYSSVKEGYPRPRRGY